MLKLKLAIVLVRGELLSNTKKIAKMNTYLVLRVGENTYKTNICKYGGTTPHWDEKFISDYQEEDFSLEIWEYDFGNQKLLGNGVVNIKDFKDVESQTLWVKIYSNETFIGKVLVHIVSATEDKLLQNAIFAIDPYIKEHIFKNKQHESMLLFSDPMPQISFTDLLREQQAQQDKLFSQAIQLGESLKLLQSKRKETNKSHESKECNAFSKSSYNENFPDKMSKQMENTTMPHKKYTDFENTNNIKFHNQSRAHSQPVLFEEIESKFKEGAIQRQPDYNGENGISSYHRLDLEVLDFKNMKNRQSATKIQKAKTDYEALKALSLPKLSDRKNSSKVLGENRSSSVQRSSEFPSNNVNAQKSDRENYDKIKLPNFMPKIGEHPRQQQSSKTMIVLKNSNHTPLRAPFIVSSKSGFEDKRKLKSSNSLSQIGHLVIHQQY